MTMGCSCSEEHVTEHSQKVNELLDSVGIKEVVEQGRGALEEAGRALQQLNRSERAASLGFGSEVASIHADAAARSNQRAQDQVRTVLARIDHVVQGEDWAGHVQRVRKAFKEHDGTRKLVDLRADVRLRLLEADPGMNAAVAELTLASLDGAIKAASEGDLNEVIGHMREVMAAALRGFESPEMGRQSIGHGLLEDERDDGIGGGSTGWCIALAACIAWAVSSLVASLIACFAFIWCVCCWHLAILATFAAHMLLCSVILDPLCRAK
jgi:hypothetical protein